MTDRKSAAFMKAVRFIWDNIDQPIKLEEIANASGVSLSSLKRLFADTVHNTPGDFLRRFRMELALRSLQCREDTVLEIALSSGFDNHSAFTRCFKNAFGYSPAKARNKFNIVNELESISLEEPEIIELSELKIQCISQQGLYYESAKKAWDALKEKLKSEELIDFASVYIGIGHDNPHEGEIPPDKVRYSAGVALLERDLEIEHHMISGGMYARFHYVGKPMNLGLAYHYIYGKWLEDAEFKINKKIPAFMAYERFPIGFRVERMLIHVPLLNR